MICETLRLYPTDNLTARKLEEKSVKLSYGYTALTDTLVYVPTYAVKVSLHGSVDPLGRHDGSMERSSPKMITTTQGK